MLEASLKLTGTKLLLVTMFAFEIMETAPISFETAIARNAFEEKFARHMDDVLHSKLKSKEIDALIEVLEAVAFIFGFLIVFCVCV